MMIWIFELRIFRFSWPTWANRARVRIQSPSIFFQFSIFQIIIFLQNFFTVFVISGICVGVTTSEIKSLNKNVVEQKKWNKKVIEQKINFPPDFFRIFFTEFLFISWCGNARNRTGTMHSIELRHCFTRQRKLFLAWRHYHRNFPAALPGTASCTWVILNHNCRQLE